MQPDQELRHSLLNVLVVFNRELARLDRCSVTAVSKRELIREFREGVKEAIDNETFIFLGEEDDGVARED